MKVYIVNLIGKASGQKRTIRVLACAADEALQIAGRKCKGWTTDGIHSEKQWPDFPEAAA